MGGYREASRPEVSQETYTATVNTEFAGEDHCVSFDFTPEKLPLMIAGLPVELAELFLEALSRAPFMACTDLVVEVDLRAHLGRPIEIEHETFVPLVIDEVLESRFNPELPTSDPADIPPHIFRLSKTFELVDPAAEDA
jgi:hypothetical protein